MLVTENESQSDRVRRQDRERLRYQFFLAMPEENKAAINEEEEEEEWKMEWLKQK